MHEPEFQFAGRLAVGGTTRPVSFSAQFDTVAKSKTPAASRYSRRSRRNAVHPVHDKRRPSLLEEVSLRGFRDLLVVCLQTDRNVHYYFRGSIRPVCSVENSYKR